MEKQLNNACPLCEETKQRPFAVCFSCHNRFETERNKTEETYKQQVISAVYNERPEPVPPNFSKEEWIRIELLSAIPRLGKKVKELEDSLAQIKKTKNDKIEEIYKKKAGNKELPPDIKAGVLKMINDNDGTAIWRDLGGNKIFRDLENTKARLIEAKRLMGDLVGKKTIAAIATIPPVFAETVQRALDRDANLQ